MPTRTLSGWTPGSPIDAQKLRLYRNMGLAGTYDLANDATSVQVAVVENSLYQADLRSVRETDESSPLTKMFYVGGEMGEQEPELQEQSEAFGEYVPPPTGEITVSDP